MVFYREKGARHSIVIYSANVLSVEVFAMSAKAMIRAQAGCPASGKGAQGRLKRELLDEGLVWM